MINRVKRRFLPLNGNLSKIQLFRGKILRILSISYRGMHCFTAVSVINMYFRLKKKGISQTAGIELMCVEKTEKVSLPWDGKDCKNWLNYLHTQE